MNKVRKTIVRSQRKQTCQRKAAHVVHQPCACLAGAVRSLVREYLEENGLHVNLAGPGLQANEVEKPAELKNLREKLERLQQELTSEKTAKDSLEKECEKAKKDLANSENNLRACNDNLEASKNALTKCQKDLESTNIELGNATQNLPSLQAERSRLESDLKIAKNAFEASQKSLSECNASLQSCQQYLTACNSDLNAKKAELAQRQNDIARLEKERSDLRKELDVTRLALVETTDQRDYYMNSYAALDKAYNTCLGLPERMRYELRGVFGDLASPAGFLCGALNPDHLESLWDYLAGGLNNGQISSEDEDRLKQLFDFCFAAVNQSGREPRYRRFGVMPGAEHDDRKMQLASESRQLGKVAKVLLDGYCHATSGKPVRSSLVTLA